MDTILRFVCHIEIKLLGLSGCVLSYFDIKQSCIYSTVFLYFQLSCSYLLIVCVVWQVCSVPVQVEYC